MLSLAGLMFLLTSCTRVEVRVTATELDWGPDAVVVTSLGAADSTWSGWASAPAACLDEPDGCLLGLSPELDAGEELTLVTWLEPEGPVVVETSEGWLEPDDGRVTDRQPYTVGAGRQSFDVVLAP